MAVQDVEDIYGYIAEDNETAAARMYALLFEEVERLQRMSGMGRPGRVTGTRELVVPATRYIVAYRVEADAVYILRILHGAQRWPRDLSTGS